MHGSRLHMQLLSLSFDLGKRKTGGLSRIDSATFSTGAVQQLYGIVFTMLRVTSYSICVAMT